MTTQHSPLAREFHQRVTRQSPAQVAEWCRGLSPLEIRILSLGEEGEALDALSDEDVPAADLEQRARRMEILAEVNPDDRGAQTFAQLAADLRRAPRWRAERKGERERSIPRRRVVEAASVAATCWRDQPVPERIQRIEVALRRIGELAAEAEAQGELEEAMAIGQHASSVLLLRRALDPSATLVDRPPA